MSASSVRGVSRLHVLIRVVFCGLFILYLPGRANAQVSVLPGGPTRISTVAGIGTSGYSGDGGLATSAELAGPQGVAMDRAGNLYIADTANDRIRKVDAATGTITTVAGIGISGAGLLAPLAVAVDAAGNLYIAGQSRVRKMDAATGTISTVAGTGIAGYFGDGGPATSAQLSSPHGVAVDSTGNLYIADTSNHTIRKVDAGGTITRVAGGTFGSGGDGGPATSAQLKFPNGVAVDSAGNLYIADNGNSRIRKVDAATGDISTVAGTGAFAYGGDGGSATSAQLNNPRGVAVDAAGNLYIADFNNNRIRKVDAATGIISTVAGDGTASYGGDGGLATSAQLDNPTSVAVDVAGNLYIADGSNRRIRKVAPDNSFPKTAVSSISAPQNVFLRLDAQQSITSITAVTSQGGKQEYVVDAITGCVVDGSTVNASGTICTVPVTFAPGYPGQRNAPLKVVTDTGTYSVGLSGTGTGPQVVFTPGIISTVVGNGTIGFGGDGGPATSAQLGDPFGIAVDTAGNVYIADSGNSRIRKVDATGTITTVAGDGSYAFGGDSGPATSAQLWYPFGVAVDGIGNLYIADTLNSRIRKVDATGTITTVAGDGSFAFGGDGGPATIAKLNFPTGVAVDSAGNLYIADTNNSRIRKVGATGTITTVAGTGAFAFGGDGTPANSAQIDSPIDVAVDAAGNLYIADTNNNRIRKVDATGTITTVAGDGSLTFGGDGGPATSAQLGSPFGVALDAAGNLYIADTTNDRIRKVDAATGTISTVAGPGTPGPNGDGGPATNAFIGPIDVAVDAAGNLYILDFSNNRIRKVDVSTSLIRFNTATNVGSVDATDGPQTVVLSNIGNADLQTPVLTGSNPNISANFTLNACAQISAPGVLTSGANCDFSVTFAPQSAGSIVGSLVITDGALVPHTVGLSGTGLAIAPTLSFSVLDHTSGDAPFAVTATSNSSGAISYSVLSGPATISGNIVTLTGTGVVTLRASQAASGNYTAGTVTTSFAVSAPPTFSLSLASGEPGSRTVRVGETATYNLVMTPATSTYPNAISFSVTGLPAGATATFSPSMIPAGSATTPFTLAIHTSKNLLAHNGPPTLFVPVVFGFLFIPLFGMESVRRRVPLMVLTVALSLGAVAGLSGCGGHGSYNRSDKQTRTSHSLGVTATDTTTGAQASINVTLTVQ